MTHTLTADLLNPRHAEATVALLDHYAQDDMGGGAPLSDFVRAHLVRELLRRPQAHVVLAFDGEVPVGLAILMEGFSTFACQPLMNIHDLVVARSHRGQGISRQLLRHAEAIARQQGCCKLTLEVLEGNHGAQAAYRAAGFAGYELDPAMGKAMFWQKKLDA
jgi:ribosomal protein S18 acetylase RimI-like enzyme